MISRYSSIKSTRCYWLLPGSYIMPKSVLAMGNSPSEKAQTNISVCFLTHHSTRIRKITDEHFCRHLTHQEQQVWNLTNIVNLRKNTIVTFNLSIMALPFSNQCNKIVKNHVSRLTPYYIVHMMPLLHGPTCFSYTYSQISQNLWGMMQ